MYTSCVSVRGNIFSNICLSLCLFVLCRLKRLIWCHTVTWQHPRHNIMSHYVLGVGETFGWEYWQRGHDAMPNIKVEGQTVQLWECWRTDGWMDGQTGRRTLPILLSNCSVKSMRWITSTCKNNRLYKCAFSLLSQTPKEEERRGDLLAEVVTTYEKLRQMNKFVTKYLEVLKQFEDPSKINWHQDFLRR